VAESIFRIWSARGHAVVMPPAAIDVRNATELRRLLAAAARDHPVVLLDLSETVVFDCSGLGVLLGGLHDARIEGWELRLVVGCPAPLRTVVLTVLSNFCTLFRTVPEALAARPGGVP
jgi:anti-anti-sigma factor